MLTISLMANLKFELLTFKLELEKKMTEKIYFSNLDFYLGNFLVYFFN